MNTLPWRWLLQIFSCHFLLPFHRVQNLKPRQLPLPPPSRMTVKRNWMRLQPPWFERGKPEIPGFGIIKKKCPKHFCRLRGWLLNGFEYMYILYVYIIGNYRRLWLWLWHSTRLDGLLWWIMMPTLKKICCQMKAGNSIPSWPEIRVLGSVFLSLDVWWLWVGGDTQILMIDPFFILLQIPY